MKGVGIIKLSNIISRQDYALRPWGHQGYPIGNMPHIVPPRPPRFNRFGSDLAGLPEMKKPAGMRALGSFWNFSEHQFVGRRGFSWMVSFLITLYIYNSILARYPKMYP
jgi:hypothetical protein